MQEEQSVKYILPTKVLYLSRGSNRSSFLLKEDDPQITLNEKKYFELNAGGYVVIDFGKEYAGGIRILTSMLESEKEVYKLRIRFGESLTECLAELGEKNATNNHTIRDMEVSIPSLSDQSYGETGFRFVRIDNKTSSPIRIKKIYAKVLSNNFKQIKAFHSADDTINQIFETCKRTLDLCTQNYIYDGIKRDRLVWIGDMAPEVKALLHLYGNIPQIEESLNLVEKKFVQPTWIGGMPSYSYWYLQIVNDIYKYTKSHKFLLRHKDYVLAVLKQIDECINFEGKLDYKNSKSNPGDCYFIDWPNSKVKGQEIVDANKNLLIWTLSLMLKGIAKNDKDLREKCVKMFNILKQEATDTSTVKTFAAFHYLVNEDEESYQNLIRDGAKDLSTFMSYPILTAIAKKDKKLALEIMKEYYGSMLKKGATTFWENFSMDMMENTNSIDTLPINDQKDIHGDFGKDCYQGFRHSLCHGWSVGPISFLLENYK